MRPIGVCGLGIGVVTLLFAGCAPRAVQTVQVEVPVPTQVAMPTTLLLPSGESCRFAGTDATLTVEGERVTYRCEADEAEVVLLGELDFATDSELSVTRAVLELGEDGFEVATSERLETFVARTVLADGTECLHAGFGATLAFGDRRLNYSCDDESVLLGPFSFREGYGTVERGRLERQGESWRLASSERSYVALMALREREK
jgi:hypothetical protein